jgi:hypothetical protein
MIKHILTITLFMTTVTAAASDIGSFVGSYTKMSGTAIGMGPLACPDAMSVVIDAQNTVRTVSENKDFDSQYSFGYINRGPFDCKNKGNWFANDCFRTLFRDNEIWSDYGEVPNYLPTAATMRVRNTWKMIKTDGKLTLKFTTRSPSNYEVEGTCIYKQN